MISSEALPPPIIFTKSKFNETHLNDAFLVTSPPQRRTKATDPIIKPHNGRINFTAGTATEVKAVMLLPAVFSFPAIKAEVEESGEEGGGGGVADEGLGGVPGGSGEMEGAE